jgi:hypothetical protein
MTQSGIVDFRTIKLITGEATAVPPPAAHTFRAAARWFDGIGPQVESVCTAVR